MAKWIKVRVKRRTNPPRQGAGRTVSYTLRWHEDGQERFHSLGVGVTEEFAEQQRAELELRLNTGMADLTFLLEVIHKLHETGLLDDLLETVRGKRYVPEAQRDMRLYLYRRKLEREGLWDGMVAYVWKKREADGER